MRNAFLFLAPKSGKRHTLASQHRTKEDWAKAMYYLADELYRDAEGIDVMLDNLNTHHEQVLIEIFGKAEADRLMRRLTFHYTPLYGSWLNITEIEWSVMARQYTCQRLSIAFTLATELIAWGKPRNGACVTIR